MKRKGNHHLQKPGPASKRSKPSNLNAEYIRENGYFSSDDEDQEIEYLKTAKNIIPELFSQWREFLDKDSFTDLRILCKNDGSGVSLHKAVLASCSSFLGSLLMDGRDETVLIMPDVEKRDLLNLVRILYGARTNTRPSRELLELLGIAKLPSTTVPLFTPSHRLTCKLITVQLLLYDFMTLHYSRRQAFKQNNKAQIVKMILQPKTRSLPLPLVVRLRPAASEFLTATQGW